MPETMEFPTMDPKQLDWVQNYYKLRGWAFPDAGPAASVETSSETDTQAEQPVREIVDQVQAEFTVQLIASELEHAESTHEELAELQEELRAQAIDDVHQARQGVEQGVEPLFLDSPSDGHEHDRLAGIASIRGRARGGESLDR